MLRKLLDYQLSLVEKGKPLHRLRPLITAGDTFLYEAPINTSKGPHIRDAIDVKRWMMIVVIALIPCILWAIWNTGLQSFVYGSGDYRLMNEYLSSSMSFDGYMSFAVKDDRYLTIIKLGLAAILPLVLISYAVGGFWEAVFACVRGHEISEGFLVTGILYVLILPSTIPYWMAAVGVSVGIILSKEVFGGSGMNIVNPALACRAFLFFTFPGKMSGDIWTGTNPTSIRQSLIQMNREAHTTAIDGFSQATKLAQFNVTQDIKRIHVDAIASNNLGNTVGTHDTIQKYFDKWNSLGNHQATLGELSQAELRSFVTNPLTEGGLGLSSGYYEDAYHFSELNYGIGHNSDAGFFFGDKLGSIGETSILACLLGAIYLIYTGVGSWRTMVAMGLGSYFTALIFELCARNFGTDGGAWNMAQFAFPAYKHLLIGGLAFGIVFMATDPVSSPSMASAKWIYGIFCGVITIVIRVINPAYPEGVMLAILMGNVFAPLFDYYAARSYRKRSTRRVRATA
ncbi:MAG TPA: Na(+)-transporting NADH-quinone reductase subunit B [Parachlamydiaceae bacterium]|nr:Na(+)-transporting NADH-quinone reductase subunit B [Parachlamydiaceae bacterium]